MLTQRQRWERLEQRASEALESGDLSTAASSLADMSWWLSIKMTQAGSMQKQLDKLLTELSHQYGLSKPSAAKTSQTTSQQDTD